MIGIRTAFGFLLIVGLTSATVSDQATGPSGTKCESEGGSCVGIPDGTLIPYKNNSSKYISCVNECACEMDCTPGTYFNEALQVCDCKPPPQNSTTTTSVPATGPSGTVCESAGGSCKGVPDGKLLPYENDCTKFISCFLECGCDMKCAPGTHFNGNMSACMLPEHAGCDSSSGGNPGPSNCPSEGDLCVGEKNGAAIPNTNDCGEYIICVHGCETHLKCPEGLHFNPKSKVCDYPHNAGCVTSTTTTTEQTPVVTPEPSPCPTPGPGEPPSCGGATTTTTEQTPEPSPCTTPGPGEPPSCGGGTTTTTEQTPEPSPCTTPGPGEPPSCGGATTTTTEQTPEPSPCTTPGPGEPPSCGGGTTTTTEQTPEPSTTPSYDATTTPSPEVTPEPCECPPSCPEPNPDITLVRSSDQNPVLSLSSCSGIEKGSLLPFPGSCLKFFACGDGVSYIMNCGPGLHFNPSLRACDWPQYAGCDPAYH